MEIKDVEKLAKLARIELKEGEKESLLKDMEGILEFVGQISAINTSEDQSPRDIGLINVMREDDNPHESGIYTEKLLAQVPSRQGNHVKVKKIL